MMDTALVIVLIVAALIVLALVFVASARRSASRREKARTDADQRAHRAQTERERAEGLHERAREVDPDVDTKADDRERTGEDAQTRA
jgi:flagellar biosynthesis/type III secretory pathway M-ring protein FliF/YscJ